MRLRINYAESYGVHDLGESARYSNGALPTSFVWSAEMPIRRCVKGMGRWKWHDPCFEELVYYLCIVHGLYDLQSTIYNLQF
jgi:hypothetical protein